MKALLFFLGLMAVVTQCLAETSALEASYALYYYTSYDLDFDVQGRNRTIARGCRGSGEDGKCDFNEFLNYVATGETSTEPQYYEVPASGFSFFIGDIAAIMTALQKLPTIEEHRQMNRLIKNRDTAVGLFRDLGKLADANFLAAETKNFPLGRKRAQMQLALGSVKYYALAKKKGTMLERLRKIQEVQWKIVQSNSEYAINGHRDRINWVETVKANPDLHDRNSQLFKDVVAEIKNLRTSTASMADQTIAKRVADVFEACFK